MQSHVNNVSRYLKTDILLQYQSTKLLQRHTSANTSTITITKTLPSLISSRPDPNTLSSQSGTPALAGKLLQHHLSHTTISPDESGIPCAVPTSSTTPASTSTKSRTHAPAASPDPLNFSSFASLFPTTDTTSPAPIFRLGSALFDPLELQLGRSKKSSGIISPTAITPDLRNRILLLRRKTALSKWLKDVVKPSVDADLRMQTNGSNGTVAIFNLTITLFDIEFSFSFLYRRRRCLYSAYRPPSQRSLHNCC